MLCCVPCAGTCPACDSWLLALIAPTFREVRSQLMLGPVQLVSVLSSSSFGGVRDSLLELGLVQPKKGLL